MARKRAALTRVVTVAEHHGRRFRNKYMLDGKPVSDSFETEAEAETAARKFAKEHASETGPTVTALYEKWIQARKEDGKPESASVRLGIQTMLGKHMEAPAASITPKHMVDAYAEARTRITKNKRQASVATAQEALKWSRTLWRWSVEKGYVRRDPTAGIKLVGKRNKRKPQIDTMTDLFRFRDRAWELAEGGDRAALGVLVSLYLGPRSSEVRGILARHVDRVAHPRLVIDGTKTENAYRHVRVPLPELWELLCRAADAATSPTERLIPQHKNTLLCRVRSIGREIGLPEDIAKKLTFHSLRGMAASLATDGDAAGEAIAKLLGQASCKVTKEHYTRPSSQEAADQRATMSMLGARAGKAGSGMVANQTQPDPDVVTSRDCSANLPC